MINNNKLISFDAAGTLFRPCYTNSTGVELYEDACYVFDFLKHRTHFKSVIITNWGKVIHEVIRYYDLSSYFDFIISATDVFNGKPNAEPFIKAQTLSSIEQQANCIHIGDSIYDDIEGALDAGWQAIYLNRSEKIEHHNEHFMRIIDKLYYPPCKSLQDVIQTLKK